MTHYLRIKTKDGDCIESIRWRQGIEIKDGLVCRPLQAYLEVNVLCNTHIVEVKSSTDQADETSLKI